MEPLGSLTFHGKTKLTIHKGRCLNPDSSSSVFLGWDSTAADLAVIKEFNLDEFDCSLENTGKHEINREDLENEYLRFIDLTHPNLVKLLGFHLQLENKRVYLLTEYVEGKSLKSMIEQKKWLPMKQVQEYTVQILKALAYLHSKNIHHPCLNLDNVLIDSKEQVKVINFYSAATIWKHIPRTTGNLKLGVETSKDVQLLGGMLLSLCKDCDGVGREFFDLPSELQNFLQMCNAKESTVSQLLDHAFIKCGTDIGLISSDWKMMNMFLKEDPEDQDEEDEEDEMEEDDDELNDPDDTETKSEEDFDDLECDGISATDKWSPRLQTDFKILGLLGKGAYGEVIKVQNRIDERCCAIKIIPLSITETESSDGSSSEEASRTETEKERSVLSETQQNLIMRNQIMREVQHLSKMNHENVVRYFNTWIETCEMDTELKMSGDNLKTISLKSGKEYMFIHMELCENNTLRNSIDEELCSNQQLVWKLFKEILLGLDHIHKLGIIHRDLKPENIFLSSENHVKIGDFGLARGLNMNDVFVHSELPDNHVDNVNKLTMNIGTSYYVSPEVKSKTTYDQKADIYSLGVIFFEMSYRPMPTGMERHKILNSLCQEKITLPDDFEKYGTSKQKTMIKLLLSHDPTARQTASELLKNENICEKVDESEFSNAQPNNWSNVKAVDVLFQNLKCVNSEDTYGSRSVVLFSKEQHLLLSSIERIFRKHGAREINVPLLVPKSPIYENIGFDQVLLNCHGKMLVLSKDYRIAFAHFLAYYMKSQETAKYYSISCRENRYYRFCDYDLEASVDFINVPCGMVVLYQTELMCIVKEILKNGPGSCDLIFRVNHTSLLQALLNFYQVPEENWKDILFWYEYYTKKEIVVTPLSVKSHFDHLNIGNGNRFDQFFELLAMEDSFGSVQDYLLGIFKNGCENESLVKNVSIAKNALEEIGLLVDMLKMTGSRIKVKLALGLLIDSKCYSGLVFQVVSKSESGNLHVLARGGQYDKLFNSFCCDGRSEISAQKHAVGVTIDINHIKIESSVLNSLPHVMVFSRSKKYHAKDEIIVASRLLKIGFPAIMYDGAIHGGSIMGATKFCADNFIDLLVLMRSRKDSNITITSIPDNKVIKDGCSIKEMFEFFEMLKRRYDYGKW